MDVRRSLHCEAVANDSSTTHFLVGMTSVSVTVKFGVVSTQPSANEFAGMDDKNKRKSSTGVFIFVSLRDFLTVYSVALGKQIGSQDITQHRELKWFVQNLFGPCVKGTVDTLFNVAGHRPRGIYDYGYIAGGHIPL